jgi:hypothetical protein
MDTVASAEAALASLKAALSGAENGGANPIEAVHAAQAAAEGLFGVPKPRGHSNAAAAASATCSNAAAAASAA